MTERFQPRTLASFNVHQLEQIREWASQNGVNGSDGFSYQKAFRSAIEAASLDEKGKVLDERGKNRLVLALRVMTRLAIDQDKFKDISGDIQVWKFGPNPEALELRWSVAYKGNSRVFGTVLTHSTRL